MKQINYNDLKTIGYSFKVSTNDVEDKYITYTVSDYKTDVKYGNGLPGINIFLSVSNRKEKVVWFYTHDFLNEKINHVSRLSDGIDVLVVF